MKCPYCGETMENGNIYSTLGRNILQKIFFCSGANLNKKWMLTTKASLERRGAIILDEGKCWEDTLLSVPTQCCRKCGKLIISLTPGGRVRQE